MARPKKGFPKKQSVTGIELEDFSLKDDIVLISQTTLKHKPLPSLPEPKVNLWFSRARVRYSPFTGMNTLPPEDKADIYAHADEMAYYATR